MSHARHEQTFQSMPINRYADCTLACRQIVQLQNIVMTIYYLKYTSTLTVDVVSEVSVVGVRAECVLISLCSDTRVLPRKKK